MANKLNLIGKLLGKLERSPEAIEAAALRAERRAEALHELTGARNIETSAAKHAREAAEAHAAEVAAEQLAIKQAAESRQAAARAQAEAARAEAEAAKDAAQAARDANKAQRAAEKERIAKEAADRKAAQRQQKLKAKQDKTGPKSERKKAKQESAERIKETKAENARTRSELREEFAQRGLELKEQSKIDALELEHKVKSQQLETKLRQKYGLEKKPMGTAKKIALGGGAVAGGVLGYNALTGGAANNAGTFTEAEQAGSQAAIRDAMAEGYGPVQMMAGPMPQISAANANHMGMLQQQGRYASV